ncbi:MAG: hypothetical protein KJZ85_15245 [Rhodobacteraceae bacterium]|jgi:hypothetical protein|nr:hypothetical protein [Paracoccaceae bacterium]
MRKLMGVSGVAAVLAAVLAVPAIADDNDGRLRRPGSESAEATARSFFAAEVRADGTLVSGAGAVSSSRLSVGTYDVRFNKPKLHVRCYYTANVADRDAGTTPIGFTTIDARAGTNNGVFLRVFDAAGALLDAQFIVVAVCR